MQKPSGCVLCAHRCGVDRINTLGRCKATQTVCIGRAALHFWEEPCLSGQNGSGTVFFSHCSLQCVFCQNEQISHQNVGSAVTCQELAGIFLDLQRQGAHNINLVTPTHYVPQIVTALDLAKTQGLHIPIVYNSSGYDSLEAVGMLKGYIDIYLPDFKYCDGTLARRYSHAPNYYQTALDAIEAMYWQVGEPQFDQNGMLQKGVIVRHLVLPGQSTDSKAILKTLHNRYHEEIYISIMNQYTPMPWVKARYPELARTVSEEEYQDVLAYAQELGIQNAYIQEGPTALESFIPDFDYGKTK